MIQINSTHTYCVQPFFAKSLHTRVEHVIWHTLCHVGAIVALLMALSALSLMPGTASAQGNSQRPATSSLLVKLAPGLADNEHAAAVARNGGTHKASIAALRLHVIEVPTAQVNRVLEKYRADPKIHRAEVNKTRKAAVIPSDPLYGGQWALPKIGWDAVFANNANAQASVVVAILDTGINANHPDLGANVIAGTSLLDGSNGKTDPSGHGTQIAGVVAARTDTQPPEGIAGVGYRGVNLMPVTVLDAQGVGQDSDVIAGVIWAADHDADVILMAFSGPDFSESLQEAIDYAWSRNVVLVAAAGNDGLGLATFPAGHRGVIGVAATDANDQLASFSNFGPSVFLAAPGTDILATSVGGGYMLSSGTSNSAAIVAGAAAQLMAFEPAVTNGVVVGRLARTADVGVGNGRVNLARALTDSGTDPVQPAGSAPVGSGGPFVGPYQAAARNWNLPFAGAGSGSVTLTPSTGTINAPVSCGGTGTNAASQTVTSSCAPNISTSANNATITFSATANAGSTFGGWSLPSLITTTCTGVTNPCTGVFTGNGSLTVTFNASAATTTTLSSSLNPSTYGQSVTFTAAVVTGASAVTTGSVTFIEGGTCASPAATLSGPTALNGSGQASFSTSTLTAASHTIVACYGGATGFTASNGSVTQTVNKALVTATAGGGTATYDGTAKTPSACVVSGAFTGDLTCANNPTSVGPGAGTTSIVPVVSGATLSNFTVTLVNGSYTINKALVTATAGSGTATYDGTAKTPSACVISGPFTGDLTCANNPASVGPGVGTTAIVPVVSGTTLSNFTVTSVNGSYTINKALVTATAGGGTATYDGTAKTPSACVVSGAFIGDLTCANNPASVGPGVGTTAIVPVVSGTTLSNFTVTSVNGSYAITKASSTTTITCSAASFTYTGAAITPCTATVTGAGGLNTMVPVTYASNTNVGTATADASYAGDANHLGSTATQVTFAITKASSTTTITCSAASFTYTGAAITPCTATVTGAGGLNTTVPVTYASNINVGTATADASYAGDANHLSSTATQVTFAITKASSTTTITCSAASFTYTGAAITPCTATVTGAGGLNTTVPVTYASNTNVGTATADASYAGDANHLSSTATQVTFAITQAPSVTTVTCPASVVYTGAAQTPCTVSVTGVGGLSLTPTPTYTNNTNAGTATASYTYAGDANHTGSTDSKSFAITQASSTTTITCSAASFTYTGAAITPCTATVTGAGGLNTTVPVTYASNINVGTATADASYAGDANHLGSTATQVSFAITQAPSVTTVTCPASVVYTGAAQTPCTATVTGAGGLSLTPTPIYANNTNVGTASASYTYAGDANHAMSSDSDSFTITKYVFSVCDASGHCTGGSTPNDDGIGGILTITPSVTFNGSATATVNLSPASFGGVDVLVGPGMNPPSFKVWIAPAGSPTQPVLFGSGVATKVGDDWHTQITQTLDITLVPGNYIAYVYGDDGAALTGNTVANDAGYVNGDTTNLVFPTLTALLTVTKAPSITTITCPANVIYTGAAQIPCTATVTGAGGLNTTVPVTYASNTNVGTATADASYAGDANHLSSTATQVTFAITQAPSVTTVTCPASVVYTGAAQTPCTVSVTGVGGLSLTPTPTYTNNTNVGSATASYTYSGDANHTGSSDSKSFAITQAPSVTTVTCPASVVYTGAAQTPCTATVTGAGGLNTMVPVTYASNTNVGTATADASYAGDANHLGSTATQVTFAITQAPSVTTVTCPASVVYTGAAQTPCTVSVTGVGGLSLTPTPTYTNNTNAGTATASYTYAGDANHSSSSGSKTFLITQAPSVTTVTCPASVVYTGAAQTPCTATVTGAGGLSLTPTPSYVNNTNTGTATVSYAYAGDANHSGSSGSKAFAITQAPSVTTVTCPASVIYNASAQTPCTAVVTGAGGLNLTPTPTYANNLIVGTATASYTYAGDANHTGSSDTKSFAILPRSAFVRYIGQTSFVTSGASATTAQVTLSASVQDPTGLGLVGAKVDFIDASNSKILASGVNVSPVANSVGNTGTANTIVTLSTGQFGAEAYVILVKMSGNYTNNDQAVTDKTATVVVSKPAITNETIGVGAIAGLAEAGTYGTSGSAAVTYSIGMAYNKSVTNLQGKISLTIPQSDGTVIMVKSNAISSMAVTVVADGKQSTIYTKANVERLLTNGTTVSIDSGATLRVDSYDYSLATSIDQVGFTVMSSKTSQLHYSNRWMLDAATNAWRTVTEPILPGSSLKIN